MITKKLLCWYKNGKYSAHLHTTRETSDWKLRVRTKYTIGTTGYEGDLYCPSYPSTSTSDRANKVCFYSGSTIYHVEDITPRFKLTVGSTYDPQPYKEPYVITYIAISDGSRGEINNKIEVKDINGVTRLELPAGAGFADVSPNFRIGSTSFRLKIGDWYSSYITSGGTVDIPEAQWGV